MLSLIKNIAKCIKRYKHNNEVRKCLSIKENVQNRSITNLKCLCTNKRILMLVPHADDELLGNYGLLTYKEVDKTLLYLQYTGSNPLMEQTRRMELLNLARDYNLSIVVSEQESRLKILKQLLANNTYDYILVPSYIDWHHEHRAVATFLFMALKELQVSSYILLYHISVPHPLNWTTHYFPMKKSDSSRKYKIFHKYYPSQNVNTVRFQLQEVLSAKLFSINNHSIETYIGMTVEDYILFIYRLSQCDPKDSFDDWILHYNNIYTINDKVNKFYLTNKEMLRFV